MPPSTSGREFRPSRCFSRAEGEKGSVTRRSEGRLAQLVRAPALQAGGRRFESCTAHQVWHSVQELGEVRLDLRCPPFLPTQILPPIQPPMPPCSAMKGPNPFLWREHRNLRVEVDFV